MLFHTHKQNDVQLVPLICNTFYFLPDAELSTRQMASGNLRTLLTAVADKAKQEEAATGERRSKCVSSLGCYFYISLYLSGSPSLDLSIHLISISVSVLYLCVSWSYYRCMLSLSTYNTSGTLTLPLAS